jgi:hypothetical protein
MVQQEGTQADQAGQVDVGAPHGAPTAALLHFPGFVKTEFSTADHCYFYEGSREESRLGSGKNAIVREYVALLFGLF